MCGSALVALEYTDVVRRVVRRILDEQRDSGAWGTYNEGEDDLRSTALCVIALTECSFYVGEADIEPFINIEDKAKKVCKWIAENH